MIKNPSANAGNLRNVDSIPGSRRFPGEGNGNPLQYSCLGNPIDREDWQAAVHGVAKESEHNLPTCPFAQSNKLSINKNWLNYVVSILLLFSCWVMTDSLQSLGLQHTIPQSLLKLVSIESVIYSNHLIFYSPLLLPSVFPSIRVFSLSKQQQQKRCC